MLFGGLDVALRRPALALYVYPQGSHKAVDHSFVYGAAASGTGLPHRNRQYHFRFNGCSQLLRARWSLPIQWGLLLGSP